MKRYIETKNVFKHITKEITAKCAAKGQNVSSACALRIMKITMQNPEYDFGAEMMTRNQIQQLISTCVNQLTVSVGPASRTIEMQVYFSSHYTTREEIAVEHRHTVLSRTDPLILEVKEASQGSADEMRNHYRKLVVVITLLSGLGNPTASSVLKEATAALHSVFPLSELSRFIALSEEDKMKQIIELKQIVSGIRLFNKESNKGGEGIDDMPSILQQAVAATKEQLLQSIQQTQETVDQLTAWLSYLYKEDLVDTDTLRIKLDLPTFLVDSDLALLKENTVHLVQYLRYLRVLLDDVKASERDIIVLCARVTERLLHLHDTVRYRTAIPTNQVYPQFMDLSISWFSLQDQMVVLSTLNQILYTLQNMAKVPELTEEKTELLSEEIKLASLKEDENKVDKNVHLKHKIRPYKVKCEVLELVNVEDCNYKQIQYYGHCAFKFVETNGCLIPADLSLGLLRYNKLLFAFSSVEGAHTFGRDPDRYYQQGLDIVVHRPELIVLFDMDEQIQNLKPTSKTPTSAVVPKYDSETQTELHPIPSYKDPSYSWNIWDYKREAIHLADISKMRTRSSQTAQSHFRLNMAVQSCPAQDVGSQLVENKDTGTSRTWSYIVGLRGSWLRDQFQANNLWNYIPHCPSSKHL